LRQDNADLRLGEMGYALGLAAKEDYLRIQEKKEAIKKGKAFLRASRLKPDEKTNKTLAEQGIQTIKKSVTLEELLKRPGVTLEVLKKMEYFDPRIPEFAFQQVEIEVKYAGFIERQLTEVEKFKHLEKIKLPQSLDYLGIPGLSREIKEKLNRFQPVNLGQASRISGVTPAAISILMIYLKKLNAEK